MADKRNSYLVSKALKTFMFASILAALAQQMATTTDAIVVSHLIECPALNISVRLTRNDLALALKDIAAFLKECEVDHSTAYNVNLCCDELISNIVNYAVEKHPEKHYVDVHIRCTGPMITVLLKDDGRPFNPMLHETPEGIEHLGLRLVNSTNHSMTYKYMYDQNMVYMTFTVTNKTPI